MAELISIEILMAGDQHHETIPARCSGCTASVVLDLLSRDSRCGQGTLSDKDNILMMGQEVLSLEGQPYKFRKLLTISPTKAPMVKFKELLKQGGISLKRVDQKVLDQIQSRFSIQLLTLDTVGQAMDLYDAAKAMPGKTTSRKVQEELGITINGPLPGQDKLNMLSAINADGHHLVVKVLHGPRWDRLIELQMCKALDLVSPEKEEDVSAVAFIQAKAVQVTIKQDSRHPEGTFDAVLMARYMSTLSEVPQLNSRVICAGGRRIQTALEHMHGKKLVHMDLKPDNILTNGKGQWFLGDFGSACTLGEPIRSMTVQYYPEQLLHLTRDGDESGKMYNETAKCEYDYYMLGVTLMCVVLQEDGGEKLLIGSTGRVCRELMSEAIARLPEGDLKQLIVDIMSRSVLS